MMDYNYREARSLGLPRRPSLECVSDSGESSSSSSRSSSSSSDDNESRDASNCTTDSCRERRKVRFEESANRTIQVARYSDTNEKLMIWYTGGDFMKFQRNFRKSKSESTVASMSSTSSSPSSSPASSSSSSTASLSSSYSISLKKHRPMETLESFNGSERSRRSRKTVSRSVLLHQDFYRRRSDELTLVDVDTHERLSAISSSLTEQDRIQALKAAASNAHETECFRIEAEQEHLQQQLQDEDEEESMLGRYITTDDLNNNLTSSSPFCFVQYYNPISPSVLLSKILLCGCE